MKNLRTLTVLLIVTSFLFSSNLVMDWGNSKGEPMDTTYKFLNPDSVRVIRVIKRESKDTAFLFTKTRSFNSNIELDKKDLKKLAQGDTLEKVIKTNSIVKQWYPLTLYNEETVSLIAVQNGLIKEIDRRTKGYTNLGCMFWIFEILPLVFIVLFFLTNLSTSLKNIVKFSALIVLFMIGTSLIASFACDFIIGYAGWLVLAPIVFLFLIVYIGGKYWDIIGRFFIFVALYFVELMIMIKSAVNASYTGIYSDMILPVWPYIGGVSALFLIYVFLRWLRGEDVSS